MVSKLLLVAAAALPVLLASVDASACRRGPDNVSVNPVITRPDSALVRAAELEREARAVEQRAVFHASRAESARAAVTRLQDVLPASFGEEREAIFERIDALLERAATETGEARALRLRASELRAQAARLRAQAGQGGGGWKGRGPVPRAAALDV